MVAHACNAWIKKSRQYFCKFKAILVHILSFWTDWFTKWNAVSKIKVKVKIFFCIWYVLSKRKAALPLTTQEFTVEMTAPLIIAKFPLQSFRMSVCAVIFFCFPLFYWDKQSRKSDVIFNQNLTIPWQFFGAQMAKTADADVFISLTEKEKIYI